LKQYFDDLYLFFFLSKVHVLVSGTGTYIYPY